jgi:hypothetical protein
MVDDIEVLIDQASRLARSQYTRQAERTKWTRLAGQLIWYKDQILRSMTFEALEQDVFKLMRDLQKDRERQEKRSRVLNPPWAPTLYKKKEEAEEKREESEDSPVSSSSDDSEKQAETSS